MWTGLKLRGKAKCDRTYRCRRCGYLESYAEAAPRSY